MYINDPVLKGSRKMKPKTVAKIIDEYEFSSPVLKAKGKVLEEKGQEKVLDSSKKVTKNRAKTQNVVSNGHNFRQNQQKNYIQDEIQFQDNLIINLNQLLARWDIALKTIQSDLKKYQLVQESETQVKAFNHCLNLLENQFAKSQNQYQNSVNLIQKKILQIDDYKLRLMKQIGEMKEENSVIRKENEKIEEFQKLRQKQTNKKKEVLDKIYQQKLRVQQIKNSIHSCKQKSLEQKNQFIQIQSQQFRLQNQIQQTESQQIRNQQQQILYQKYIHLQKIKQKVIASKQNMSQQIRPHLQRKIQKMAKLRTEITTLDQTLNLCISKIEDQVIIVDALRQKSYHQSACQYPKSQQGDLYGMYHKRYSEIYFGGNNNNSNGQQWNDYKKYLKQLMNKNKIMNSRVFTEMPNSEYEFQKKNKYESEKMGKGQSNQLIRIKKQIPNTNRINTRQHFYKRSSYNPEYQKSTKYSAIQDLKLPKLGKNQTKDGFQEQYLRKMAKQQVIKMKGNNHKQKNQTPKDSDFQLHSINSNDSQISGQIIQVEFHKK